MGGVGVGGGREEGGVIGNERKVQVWLRMQIKFDKGVKERREGGGGAGRDEGNEWKTRMRISIDL